MKQRWQNVANLRMGPACIAVYFFSEIFHNRRVVVCFVKYTMCNTHLQHSAHYLVKCFKKPIHFTVEDS